MEIIIEKKSKLVSASFWCCLLGILSFVAAAVFSSPYSTVFFLVVLGAFVPPIFSLLLGLLLYWQNYRGPRSAAGKVAAKQAIASGIVGILLVPILFNAYVFIQQRMRPEPRVVSPIGSLRIINAAAREYADAHPDRGFPASLADLSLSHNSANDPFLIDDKLASGHRGGYFFTYTPRSTHHDGKLDAYDTIAEPEFHDMGDRYYFSDETGVITFSRSRDPSQRTVL